MTLIVVKVLLPRAGPAKESDGGTRHNHKFIWQIYMIAVWHVFAATRVSNSAATVLFDRIHHHQAAAAATTSTPTKNCNANKNHNKDTEKNKWNVLLCVAKVNAGMSQSVRRDIEKLREREKTHTHTQKNRKMCSFCLFTLGFVPILMCSVHVSPIHVIKSSVHSLRNKKTAIDCISRAYAVI